MPWVGSTPSSQITFDAVVDELRVRAPELSQARAVMFVTWRLAEMIGDADYRRKVAVLTTTVAGQDSYDIPSDVIDIRRVWIGDGRYDRATFDDVVELRNDRASLDYSDRKTGVFAPTETSSGDPQIIFWPTPDTSGDDIVAEESYQGSDVAYGSGAVTVLPTHFVPRLLDGALAEAYKATSRQDLAQYHDQLFYESMEKLRRYKNTRVGSGPVRIRLTR